MAREHQVFSFRAAAESGNYDELPMLPEDVDLQVISAATIGRSRSG